MSRKLRMPKAGKDLGYSAHAWSRSTTGVAIPYLVCPASCLVAWPLAAGMHLAWGDSPWATVGLTVIGGGLTALTWMSGRPRGMIRQVVSTIMASGAAVWTLGAVISAPWNRPWIDLWALGSMGASLAVAVMRVQGKSNGTHPDTESGRQGDGLTAAVAALKDARLGKPKVEGARVTTSVVMAPGDTIGEVEAARDEIASVLDVSTSAVRVQRDPDSVRRGGITVVPVDQLKEPIPWGGPSAPGRSVGDAPFRCGRDEDGSPVELWLTGRPGVRPATHIRATGMTGAGKSEWALTMMADYATRTDGYLVVIDTVKRDQTVKPVKAGINLLITSDDEAETFFDALLERVIPARTQALADEDLTEWMTGCSLLHMLVWVEESAAWARHDAMVGIAERARSAGVSIVLSQQRWTHDRAPTSLRAQFATNICFGIDGRDDPSLALSEATVDAGACPQTWGSSKPGYFYAESPSIPQSHWATPCRGELSDRGELSASVEGWARVRRPVDAVTAGALASVLGVVRASAATGGSRGDGAGDDLDSTPTIVIPGAEPPADVDPGRPIEPIRTERRMVFPLPDKIDPKRARSILRQDLAARIDRGDTEVRPADLSDVIEKTGYGASWLTKALRELAAEPGAMVGLPTKHGTYPLLRPGPSAGG